MCPLLVVCGKLAERTGKARIFILVGACFVAVGSGLLTLVDKDSSIAMLVGFEVISGLGFGMVLNISMSGHHARTAKASFRFKSQRISTANLSSLLLVLNFLLDKLT